MEVEFQNVDISGDVSKNKIVHAQSLEEAVDALDPIEATMLVAGASLKVRHYEDLLMPGKADPALESLARRAGTEREKVSTSQDAQRAALLWQHYVSLHAALEGRSLQGDPGKTSEVRRLHAEYLEAVARVNAVRERGDWGPIKAALRERVEEPRKPGLFRRRPEGWDQRQYEHEKTLYKIRSTGRNMDRARRILQMIPNKTEPIDPVDVDPNPLVQIRLL